MTPTLCCACEGIINEDEDAVPLGRGLLCETCLPRFQVEDTAPPRLEVRDCGTCIMCPHADYYPAITVDPAKCWKPGPGCRKRMGSKVAQALGMHPAEAQRRVFEDVEREKQKLAESFGLPKDAVVGVDYTKPTNLPEAPVGCTVERGAGGNFWIWKTPKTEGALLVLGSDVRDGWRDGVEREWAKADANGRKLGPFPGWPEPTGENHVVEIMEAIEERYK